VRDGIEDEKAMWLQAAMADLGELEGVTVTTVAQHEPEAFAVELTEIGLNRFHSNCYLRPFILVPESLSFALLDQADYFYIVAGPESFVAAATGGPLSETLEAFEQYAMQLPGRGATREWLSSTAARYRGLLGAGPV
jgi:hypothetical protein